MSWAFLTRTGGEIDLIEELLPEVEATQRADGLVTAPRRPKRPDAEYVELAFARQAMEVAVPKAPLEVEALAARVARSLQQRFKTTAPRWTLQVVAPESRDPRDPRKRLATTLAESLPEALRRCTSPHIMASQVASPMESEWLAQVWIADSSSAFIGLTAKADALSAFPAGRIGLTRDEDSPSRAGLKLEEAIQWVGLGPEPGDLCADLGAAPGGWSKFVVGLGAKVIAVDPAQMKVEIPRQRLTHIQESAFEFAPSETLDWLLCDMAWRPLEVAKLIAKWGRRAWAYQLIANFKLPMKKKALMLREIRAILEDAGWCGVRARQLFYDRDEVTLFAWLDPNLAKKGAQAPFQFRAAVRAKARGSASRDPRARTSTRASKGKQSPREDLKRPTKTRRTGETSQSTSDETSTRARLAKRTDRRSTPRSAVGSATRSGTRSTARSTARSTPSADERTFAAKRPRGEGRPTRRPGTRRPRPKR